MSYVTSYDRFSLCCLDKEGNERTRNYYWYTVLAHGSIAHTAFRKRSSLMRWAEERCLIIIGELPEHGTHAVHRIAGTYRTALYMDRDAFDRETAGGLRTRDMSNGDWTLAIITTDGDGIRTVHTLNPNVLDRPVFNRRESLEMLG